MPNTTGPTQRLLRLAYPLMLVLVIAANVQAQDKPVQAPVPERVIKPVSSPVLEHVVKPGAKTTETLMLTPLQFRGLQEMEAARAAVGGGVSERLQGITDVDTEQNFRDLIIKKLMSQKADAPTLGPASPTRPVGQHIKGPTAASAQAVLRASAKKLEDIAAELEQVPFYDEADELRAMAAKYWLQARSMD